MNASRQSADVSEIGSDSSLPGRGLSFVGWVLAWLRLFTLRHARRSPWQTVLLTAILGLGIAVYFAVRLANRAAVAGFDKFTDLISAESDWILTAPGGDLPESVLSELRDALGAEPVTIFPVIETTAAAVQSSEERSIDGAGAVLGNRQTFEVYGLDLVAIRNLASESQESAGENGWFASTNKASKTARTRGVAEGTPTSGPERELFWSLFTNPRAVYVSEALAERDGLELGDTLDLILNERVEKLEIAGWIPSRTDQPDIPASLMVMDLPALQALTGRLGILDRVEIFVEPGPNHAMRREAVGSALKTWAGERFRLTTPGERRAAGEMMTRAFRLNLTILSLLSLLVGLYLMFQSLDGAVVRRRGELAILRALGVSEHRIRMGWLAESVLLGLVGGVLGALAGWGGAQWAVRIVGRTVHTLYHSTHVETASLSIGEFGGAVALAVSAGVLAGWVPSRLAAATPPAQIIGHRGSQPRGPRRGLTQMGFIFLAAGVVCLWFPPLRWTNGMRFPLAGYLAALFWVFGGGLVTGATLGWNARWLRGMTVIPVMGRLALSHLVRPTGRHCWAAACLLCAVAMTSGMAILVSSFDTTMRGWIERTFQSDLYVSSDGIQSASARNRIERAAWREIVEDPRVARHNVIQSTDVTLDDGPVMIVGMDLRFAHERTRMAWRQAPKDERVHDSERNAELMLVSESFSERFQKEQGDIIRVPTPSGVRNLEIAGVFSDYGNERGSMMVDRVHWAAWFGHEQATSLILELKDGKDADAMRADLRAKYPGLMVMTQRHLRQEILRIFRQTFAITHALELIGVLVSVVGLGMALGSVLLDRRSELTLLRALGVRHRELAIATAWEGGLLSLVGTGLGLLVSLALGWLLIFVINKQTFGWTLEYSVPWAVLGILSLLVLVSGTGVSMAVGRWGAGLPSDRVE